MAAPKTIDAYLDGVAAGQRAALQKLRATIKAAAPGVEEVISYGVPAFRLGGKNLVGLGASKTHCSLFLMSGATVRAHAAQLTGFGASKGAVRFTPEEPLPAALVKKLVKARIAEIGAAAAPDVARVVKMLERDGSAKFRAEMAPRYGIVAKTAFGTPMAKIKAIAKACGKDHALAAALWKTGIYEARLLASMVDEPKSVTVAQMDRWAKDFENWGDCDTVCFNLFDRTPHALGRVRAWAKSRDEFVKRAAFALMASVALHRKDVADAAFAALLPLIEDAAGDERNFVKKGVSWALRSIGARRKALLGKCAALAKRLAGSDDAAERWVGKDALRDLARR